jgi:hypothetical protein
MAEIIRFDSLTTNHTLCNERIVLSLSDAVTFACENPK